MSRYVQQWVRLQNVCGRVVPNPRPRGRDEKHLSLGHQHVLDRLAFKAWANGVTSPLSFDEIGELAGISGRQAERHVRDLIGAKLLCVQAAPRGRGLKNRYWLPVPWQPEPERIADLPTLRDDQVDGQQVRRRMVQRVDEKYDTGAQPTPENTTPVTYLGSENTSPVAENTTPVTYLGSENTSPVSCFRDGLNTGHREYRTGVPDKEHRTSRERARSDDFENGHEEVSQPALIPAMAVGPLKAEDRADELAARWARVLEQLRGTLEARHFDDYVQDLGVLRYDAAHQVLELEPADPFHVPWLEGKFRSQIYAAVQPEFGAAIQVEYRAPPIEQSRDRSPPRLASQR